MTSKLRVILESVNTVLKLNCTEPEKSFTELGGDSIRLIHLISLIESQGFTVDLMKLDIKSSLKDMVSCINVLDDSQETTDSISSLQLVSNDLPSNHMLSLQTSSPREDRNSFVIDSLFRVSDSNFELYDVIDVIVAHCDGLGLQIIDPPKVGVAIQGKPTFYCKTVQVDSIEKLGRASSEVVERCQDARSNIDVFDGPLLSAVLFQDENSIAVYLCIHHTVSDYVSFTNVKNWLQLGLADFNRLRSLLRAKVTSYIDYYAELKRIRKTQEYEDAVFEMGSRLSQFNENVKYELRGVPHKSSDSAVESITYKGDFSRADTRTRALLFCMIVGELTSFRFGYSGIRFEETGREIPWFRIPLADIVGWLVQDTPIFFRDGETLGSLKEFSRFSEVFDDFHRNSLVINDLRYTTLSEISFPKVRVVYWGAELADERTIPISLTGSSSETTKDYDFRLSVTENGMRNGISIDIEYSRAQYTSETIKEFLKDIAVGFSSVNEKELKCDQ